MSKRVLNTAVFSLLRYPNLILVALVQALLYAKVLLPAFQKHGILPELDALRLGLFIFTTLCITAGGYIVNDIIDVPVDRINRPDKVIVGRRMEEQTVYWLYLCLNLAGFTTALYLGFYVQQIALAGLFPLATGGLFLYSAVFKRLPLTGNIIVSLYCAAVAGIMWFAEREAFYRLGIADRELQLILAEFLIGYMILAFLATMFRELLKDLQDRPGDEASGAHTFPIKAGEKAGKTTAIVAGTATAFALILLLVKVNALFYAWSIPVVLAAVIVPTGIGLMQTLRARTPEDYRRTSVLAKWIILAGMLLPVFIHP